MHISRGHSQILIATALSLFACNESSTELLPSGTGGAYVATGGSPTVPGTQGVPGAQGGSILGRGGAGATLGGKGGALTTGAAQGGSANAQGGSGVVAQGGKATGGTTARTTGGSGGTSKGGASATTGGKASGGSTSGTGGKSTTGGATSTGGISGVGGGTVAAGGTASTNGYVSADPWKGYAWTAVSAAGATISPANFKAVKSGDPLCVTGTVNSSTKSDSVAMVGINLNQALGATAIGTWAVTGSGIKVNVTNKASTVPLRVQIQTPDGSTVETERWCAKLDTSTTGTKTIPWGDFNTKCWDNSGTFFDKSKALSAVLIMVPGNDKTNLTYDYCVNSIALDTSTNTGTGGSGGGGSGGAGGAGSLTGSGTLTGQYESTHVQRDGKDYVVQNNVWGASAAQSVKYVGNTFEITQQTGSNGGQGAPVSYPSAFIGSNNNRTTTGSNLPKQISTIQSVQTSWSTNAGSVSGTYNASYDVWFSTGAGGDAGSPSGGYLMVWLYDPSSAQPIGELQSGSFSSAGGTFDVWFGYNNSKPCVSYLYRGNTTSLSFDLNLFIKDAVSRGYLQNSWYLTNVFAGFEIWNGGVGLKSTAFYVDVK
jgi:hypothetical protein